MDLMERIERLEQLIKKPPSDDPADRFELTYGEVKELWRYDTYGKELPPELFHKIIENQGKNLIIVPDNPGDKDTEDQKIYVAREKPNNPGGNFGQAFRLRVLFP